MPVLRATKYPELNDHAWLEMKIGTMSVNAIAKELGAPRTSVRSALQRHGLFQSYETRKEALEAAAKKAAKRPTYYEHITKEDIAREYLDVDTSLFDASLKLGCCVTTLLRAIKHHGLEVKPRGAHIRKNTRFPQLGNPEWLTTELETKTMAQIAKELGTSTGNISGYAQRYGLRWPGYNRAEAVRVGLKKSHPNGRFGSHASNWQGGVRTSKAGYVQIFMPDHPHAPKNGYVMEHRLVVEKILGRYLEPREFVHHKDGDKGNNHPLNLEVMSQAEHVKHHFQAVKTVVDQEKQITALTAELAALKAAHQRTARKVERLIVDNQLRMFEE